MPCAERLVRWLTSLTVLPNLGIQEKAGQPQTAQGALQPSYRGKYFLFPCHSSLNDSLESKMTQPNGKVPGARNADLRAEPLLS